MIYVSGPGHGGQAMIANNYLDGTYKVFNETLALNFFISIVMTPLFILCMILIVLVLLFFFVLLSVFFFLCLFGVG